MRKLPVFATVGNAVGFAFGNFFMVLRLAWLPFAAYIAALAAIGYSMQSTLVEELLASDPPNPGVILNHLDELAFLYGTMLLLQVIVVSAVAVSIHRVILFGDRKPGQYFVFAFGGTEIMYAIMVALSFLGVLAILSAVLAPIAYMIVGGDFAGFLAKFSDPKPAMEDFIRSGKFGFFMGGYAVAWLVLIYFALRLAVWPPAVVATGRLALGEAWSLTRGNVLRLLGMFIVLIIVIYLIMIPVGIAVAMLMVPFALHHADAMKDVTITGPAAMHEMMREAFTPYLPLFMAVELIFYVFFTGLAVAIVSYAYKALKGVDAREPLPLEG